MKTFFLFFILLSSTNTLAANHIQKDRFTKSIRTLESVLSKDDGSKQSLKSIANTMLYGPRRVAAFNLQALGQVYQNYDMPGSKDFFKHTLRFETKSLEDALGGHDKWDTILSNLSKQKASAALIKKAQQNKKMAFAILTFVLTGEKNSLLKDKDFWSLENKHFMENYESGKAISSYSNLYWLRSSPTLIEQLKLDIGNFPWLSYDDDRTYVLSQLRKHLKNLDKLEFNFNFLEDSASEKGLHEFRREVRWFSFQAVNLNGTINFYDTFELKPKACPTADLAKLTNPQLYSKLNKSPYRLLPETKHKSENICGISRCLYYKLTKVVADIGEIKDKVEQDNFLKNFGNQTPQKDVNAAQIIFDDFKNSEVIDHLRDQIKTCYSN